MFGRIAILVALVATGAMPARAQGDESGGGNLVVAEFAAPLGGLAGGAGGAERVPAVLGARDIAAYRAIFELQRGGNWAAADALIAKLSNDVLLGHVRFQRYMHRTDYRSSYDELSAWLERYADHPGAMRVYRLAKRRQGDADAAPNRPQSGYLRGIGEIGERTAPRLPRRKLGATERKAADALEAEVERLTAQGAPAKALDALARPETERLLTAAEYDSLRAGIARALFSAGHDREAYEVARHAAARSGAIVGAAHWTAGLAAWRLGMVEQAAVHFAAGSEVEDAPVLVAGSAYWAARAFAVLHEPMMANRMLRRAAGFRRTLYGLLAQRSLFRRPAFGWKAPRPSETAMRALLAMPGAQRAIALTQVGRADLAEAEVRRLYPLVGEDMGEAVLALADALSLPGVAIRLGSELSLSAGRAFDRALYPLPGWRPASGFEIDRALLFALVRQESVFDIRAESSSGARGLMQLMPRTASYVDGDRDYHGGGADALYAPELNLALGQKYVRYLLGLDDVGGDLVRMLVAYNAGPGRLAQWLEQIEAQGDPLLFIESIPSAETRNFVRSVLANLWIYRDRIGQTATSLDDLALGRWPIYRAHEHKQLAGLAPIL